MSKIVKRTLDLFELFEQRRKPLTLSGISRALGVPVSSCHDILQAMETSGYVYRPGPHNEYYPTLRLAEKAGEIWRHDPFLTRAELEMRALRTQYGYSFFLAQAEGTTARYVLVVDARGPWRYHIETGAEVRSLHATSAGKAVLGSLHDAVLPGVLADLAMQPLTPNTHRSKDALRAELDESRARGWYVNSEESVPTATTLSVPVRWGSGLFLLTMAGPTLEVAPRLAEIAEELLRVARRLESPR